MILIHGSGKKWFYHVYYHFGIHEVIAYRTWWLKTLSVSLTLWEGNPLVTVNFLHKRPVMRMFEVLFLISLNKLLHKPLSCQWFETPGGSCDIIEMMYQEYSYIDFWQYYWQADDCWTWWRHQMGTFSTLLALYEGNPSVTFGFPLQSQWLGTLILFLMYAWTNGWANNRDTGDLRRYRAHEYVTVMMSDHMINTMKCIFHGIPDMHYYSICKEHDFTGNMIYECDPKYFLRIARITE